VEAADATLAAAEFTRRDLLVSLFAEVARNYIEARGFQRRLSIAEQNIRAQREVLFLTRDRFKAGLSSDLDVQQASVLLATTEAQLPTLEIGFEQAAHRLGVLLAQPPGTFVERLTKAALIPAIPPAVPVGLPSDLLRRRPDIQQAERELAAATARIGVAVAELFPKFSLTGSIGLQSVSAGDWFTPGSRFWSVGPSVHWRLFEAGRIRANVRVQNARQEQVLARYEQTVLTSLEEVENALTSYAREQNRLRSLTTAAQASRDALEIAGQLYQNGLADFLRVLDSQRSLYQAEDALAQSERAVALNLISIYKAIGGGWQSARPSM
jgi:NodT family efflux transporter outer membrane factor (OMF) lipoprotein